MLWLRRRAAPRMPTSLRLTLQEEAALAVARRLRSDSLEEEDGEEAAGAEEEEEAEPGVPTPCEQDPTGIRGARNGFPAHWTGRSFSGSCPT
jgi:hypothetical protein